MPLGTYRRKRNFEKTPEPSGRVAKRRRGRVYVIQKHAASRLHYDLRLELDGVLESWAVPKGPSLDPKDKRLAVQVEDHPLDYATFEGTIPLGEYGGGSVIVWDRGTWRPLEDPHEGLKRGRLKFELNGEKLKGAWMLVRMGGRAATEGKTNWLLVKERDEYARSGRDADVVGERPESVLSGRLVEEIGPSGARGRRGGAASRPAPRTKSAPPKPGSKRNASARSAPIPWRAPELATLVQEPPAGREWLHEVKFDGYRILARVDRGRAMLISRNRKDWTSRFATVSDAVSSLAADRALMDGEVVALDEHGRSDFQLLQNAAARGDPNLCYYAFDLLHHDGRDLVGIPLEDRKRKLAKLIGRTSRRAIVRYSDHVEGKGPEFYREACRRKLEGIVSKRRDSTYRSGRTRDWLKVKCSARQEFVIGGFTEPAGSREGLGALLLGVHDDRGGLRHVGRVGTGFTHAMLVELRSRLARLESLQPPFVNPPRGRGLHWVKPDLVAEVSFLGWTSDGKLRHPSFKGLREDRSPDEVVRERPADANGSQAGSRNGPDGHEPPARVGRSRSQGASVRKAPSRTRRAPARQSQRAPALRTRRALTAAAGTRSSAVTVAGVTLTHPERILYPERGLTKQDLARYYERVADRMVPEVDGRPLMLRRCPEGHTGACFFQKHPAGSEHPSLERVRIHERKGTETYLVVRDAQGLVAVVQNGVLEIHVWGARVDRIEQPDRMVFDLDPDPSVAWPRVVELAHRLRERLGTLGLESFAKTTGGKGVHVVVPLARRAEWPQVYAFSLAVAGSLVAEDPARLTAELSKARRKGKILIDVYRNGRGATWVAPYSTRARPGAPVSMPVGWDELTPRLRPDSFTVENVPQHLARRGKDPWADLGRVRQSVTAAMLRAAQAR
jgi:bifunctional non-homologous end joining protein LigD